MQRSTHKYPLIMERNPGSLIAESFRGLRTNIDFSNLDHSLRIIAVTSSQPGEGKTTTAVNLAIAYAQAGRKVLLIDADIRKPSLHELFRNQHQWGLTHLLATQCSFEEAVATTHIESLDVLVAGILPPNPSELLASGKFVELLMNAQEQYDLVIIDSPSVLLVTDTQIIASRVDGVLLVVHSGKVKKQIVRKARTVLENVKANLIGVVLNQVKKKKSKRDSYSYY